MIKPKNTARVFAAFCLIALLVAGAEAVSTSGPVNGDHKNTPFQEVSPLRYDISQTLSDQAQRMTIAFDALAFLTGQACSDSFLPPGKVADYSGFQYLRDNDPTNMGHNTDFVTRASDNVLSILNEGQLAEFIALSKTEAPFTVQYGYMRFPLMKAFRTQLEGTIPVGSTGLDKSSVMAYSAKIYEIDARISLCRAKTYASVIRSLNQTQRSYLDRMASGGMLTWPVVDASGVLRNCGQDNSVAMRTYASEMFSWFAGSVDADTYFCPERQATYFGSFYLKDRPAMGNPGYSISTTLTGDLGDAFLRNLSATQQEMITSLVDIQRADLYEIVATRTAVATELRRALSGDTIDENRVFSLSERYGELDGEISYYYTLHFVNVSNTLTQEQKQKIRALRNLDQYTCEGAYLYSQPIQMPRDIPVDFLFGLTAYNSTVISNWIQSQQTAQPAPTDSKPPQSVKNLKNTTYEPNYINWTWVDPREIDLDRILIFLNGVFCTNVSRGIGYFNATGLATNTQYTISTKTADTSGNINQTWVNCSSWTKPTAISVKKIMPSQGNRGKIIRNVNIAGTGFQQGASVLVQRYGQKDIIATGVTVVNPSTITCSIAIPQTAITGRWDLTVRNKDGAMGKGPGFFSIIK